MAARKSKRATPEKAPPATRVPPIVIPQRTPLFEDDALALCVVDALVGEGRLSTSLTIPEMEPDDDDDLDDESESWRDAVDNNQTRAIDELVALLDFDRELLAQVTRVGGLLENINDDWDYETDLYSLGGIQACTRLEHIEIWSHERSLDLRPLVSLPALASVDLRHAPGVKNLRPLLRIPALRRVVGGAIDDDLASKLRRRGVAVG
jgi:hypothetical protein